MREGQVVWGCGWFSCTRCNSGVMVAFSWLCWSFWIVFDSVCLFWLVLVVASGLGCVVLVPFSW